MEETTDDKKLFKIESPKKFQIHEDETSKSRPEKTFKIESERSLVRLPETTSDVLFTRQRNAYDCGPCFVLNTLSVLDMPTNYSSVQDVRRSVNTFRQNRSEGVLQDNSWFLTGDVAESLQAKGVRVEPFSIRSATQEQDFRQTLDEKISANDKIVVYSGTGRHFKGIYFDGGNYFLLDSNQDTITPVSRGGIDLLVTSAKTSDRSETVGIVSKRILQ